MKAAAAAAAAATTTAWGAAAVVPTAELPPPPVIAVADEGDGHSASSAAASAATTASTAAQPRQGTYSDGWNVKFAPDSEAGDVPGGSGLGLESFTKWQTSVSIIPQVAALIDLGFSQRLAEEALGTANGNVDEAAGQ